jgi:hypothetical protein
MLFVRKRSGRGRLTKRQAAMWLPAAFKGLSWEPGPLVECFLEKAMRRRAQLARR